ncbi:RIO1 family regulatory kinase/ATPase [Methanothermobacter wolfeii]|uniref:RIO1 family regulatory kinase/ATPase domain-containing protein n=1 Tax=Methanothermobacter wolfeii TaxID=145261 RepID=UPI0024B33E94|nr:RIO1 family regulatory kinase/ATPase [Methanothermobacter wolfeii]MDI6703004.1 phosphotransferase [Methanothermobacter wolfeii]
MQAYWLRKLKSKKNDVYFTRLGKDFVVIKIYRNKEGCSTEYKNLNILQKHNINAPKVMGKQKNILIQEFIEGKTLGDLIRTEAAVWIEDLAEWFAMLHRIKRDNLSFLKGDCNLQNFIVNNDGIYGIDFEVDCWGDPSYDLGKLFFFIMDCESRHSTSEKTRLIKTFLKTYKNFSNITLNHEKIQKFLQKEKEEAMKRRAGRYRLRP